MKVIRNGRFSKSAIVRGYFGDKIDSYGEYNTADYSQGVIFIQFPFKLK